MINSAKPIAPVQGMTTIRLRKDRWVSLSLNPSYAPPKKTDGRGMPGHHSLVNETRYPYCTACAFAAWMSASLRNAMTVTLRVRNEGSTTCILPSFS